MRTFSLIAVVAMLLVAGLVGGRLLATARRTRRLPELLFGCGFLGCGLGAGVGSLGAGLLWTAGSPLAAGLNTSLFAPVVFGVVALHAAVWRVFRPHDVYGFLSFAAGSSLALVGYGIRIGAGDFAGPIVHGTGMQVFAFSLVSVLSWSTIEAGHLYWRLRKQVRLGLAQPVAAVQIGLWCAAAALSAAMVSVIAYNVLTLGRSPLDDVLSTALLLVTVLGASAAMWCSFFPPASLRSRLEGAASAG